ncbi:hypothetical protein [Timonella senegalensis]|uniref:hypothetical protein n=1 Tax=Timonella senegalensis TaxID=1465825 RepID=UPI0028A9CB33|nr:hypothetical protein [Timonella senegalensis]
MTDQDPELQALIDAPTDWQQIATDAAWRVEELGSENSRLVSDMKTVNEVTRKTVEYLKATIQRVRDLHAPDAVFTDTCSECSDYGTDEHPAGRMVEHPCPTLKALEGDQA